jgi:hypothetical protein
VEIEGQRYAVAEHPAAPGIAYGQEGRAGIVYCLETLTPTPGSSAATLFPSLNGRGKGGAARGGGGRGENRNPRLPGPPAGLLRRARCALLALGPKALRAKASARAPSARGAMTMSAFADPGGGGGGPRPNGARPEEPTPGVKRPGRPSSHRRSF